MSLPASTRRRWGLDEGGEVGYLDLGDAVLLVPGGVASVRRHLLDAATEDDWANARAGFWRRRPRHGVTLLLDDQLLSIVVRGDELPAPLGSDRTIATTGYWYVRLCQAVLGVADRIGRLSGPSPAYRPAGVNRPSPPSWRCPRRSASSACASSGLSSVASEFGIS